MDTITLTVASYNIHRCVGSDGRYDVGRTAAVIRSLNADVVGLQEVSTGCEDEPSEQLIRLRDETGCQVVLGPTFECRRRGHFGNALLTRLPVRAFRPIDLSAPRREPRGAIDVDLDVHGRRLRVVSTHLGLNRIERHYQVGMLLKALAGMEPEPVLLMGDLNEWFPRRRTLGRLTERFGRTPWARTFPAVVPMLGLDRIYAAGRAEIRSFKAVYTRATRAASDHLPVRAEVMLLAPAGGREPGLLD